ncbi:MAG: hypothetical protein ABIG96_01715 [Candidatus Micrarchaeota archaeon]
MKKSEILSFSLQKGESARLSSLMDELGVESRSKLLRMALEALHSETKALEGFTGSVSGVIIASHSAGSDSRIAGMHHGFDHLIRTQMHSPVSSGCIDIFFVEGPAPEVRRMFSTFRGDAKVKNAKIFVF